MAFVLGVREGARKAVVWRVAADVLLVIVCPVGTEDPKGNQLRGI